jgi:hypothetical protein
MSSARFINLALERSPVGMGIRKIAQWVDYSDFTDSGSTTGTLTMTKQLPAGAFYIGCKASVKTGFTGDTSCTLKIGKTSGEDEFSDGTTLNIYTAAEVGEEGEAPLEFLNSAASVYLVATGASDWTLVTAGKMLVELFYLSTNPEISESYPPTIAETV